MAYNYVAIHAAIQTVLDAAGFQYVPAHDWGSFEEGVFPEALNDRGYAILLASQEISGYEKVDRGILTVTIEFILETANDLYLATLDNAVAAIGSLAPITAASLCAVIDDGELQNFNMQFLPKDTGQGKVVVQFSNIRIEVQE